MAVDLFSFCLRGDSEISQDLYFSSLGIDSGLFKDLTGRIPWNMALEIPGKLDR